MDHMECTINKEYCSDSFCKLSFISRRVKQLNWKCNLIQSGDMIKVLVKLYYRFRTGYKQFLIDVSTDYCAYHYDLMGSAVLDLVAGVLKNYSTNLCQPCPVIVGTNMSVTNLPLTSSLVQKIFVPAGEYKLVIEIRAGDKQTSMSRISLFITVPAGRTLEDDRMG